MLIEGIIKTNKLFDDRRSKAYYRKRKKSWGWMMFDRFHEDWNYYVHPTQLNELLKVVSIKKVCDEYLGEGIPVGGSGWRYKCPFCKANNRDFKVSRKKKGGNVFKCFCCGKSGGQVRFISEFFEVGTLEAVDILRHKFLFNSNFKNTVLIERNSCNVDEINLDEGPDLPF